MKKEKLSTNYLEMINDNGNFNEFPEYFFDKDTLFHYTKTKTAIKYILKDNQLKLSDRSSSIDPMESKSPPKYTEWESLNRRELDNQDSSEILNKLESDYKNLKQVCFCYNKSKPVKKLKSGYDKINYEYLGCLKPRMWDQYGDHYNGVCLVFSKKHLEKHSGLKFKKIKYYDFSDILGRKIVINENELEYYGNSKYYKLLKDKYFRQYFQKHKDYEHETEIRLYSDYENQSPLFDYRDSLKAIIYSWSYKLSKVNYYQQILEYSQTQNIDLILLIWNFDGFNVSFRNKAK